MEARENGKKLRRTAIRSTMAKLRRQTTIAQQTTTTAIPRSISYRFLVSVLVLNSCLRPFFAPLPLLSSFLMTKKLYAYTLTRKRNRRQNTATIRRTRSGTRGQKACRQHRDRAIVVAVAVAVDNGEVPVDDDRATWNGRDVQCCFGPICLDSDVADVPR